MKKIVGFLIIIISLFICMNAKALTIDTSSVTLNIGEHTYINVYEDFGEEDSITFDVIYYDGHVKAELSASNNIILTADGVHHTATLKEPMEGSVLIGTLDIWAEEGCQNVATVRIAGSEITVNVNIPVQPQPEPQPEPKKEEPKEEVVVTTTGVEEENTNLLVGIRSNIVKISLRNNVYDYSISIDNDVEKLDLEPIKKDDNTIIEMSTQVVKELKDNKITITAKNGTREETYIIAVRVRPEIVEVVKIEKTNYKAKYLAFILIFGIIILACVFFMKKEKWKG